MPYIGKSPQNGVRNRFVYNATTSSQTAFTGSDLNGNTLSISDNLYTDVYLNGILLQPSEDYSVTSTTVTLVTGASINDVLEIIVFDIFSVGDTVSASSGGTFNDRVNFTHGTHSNSVGSFINTTYNSNSNGVVHVKQTGATNSSTMVIEQTGEGGNPNDTQGLHIKTAGQNQGTGKALRVTTTNSNLNSGTAFDPLTVFNGGNVQISGNLVIGTAGNGIDFSATSDGTTSTSEVFTDYEEGMWNATLAPQSSGSVTVAGGADGCQYTKIGKMVFLSGMIQSSSVSSPTGVLRMSGFPFAIANLDDYGGRSLATINIQAGAIPPNNYGMWLNEGDSHGSIYNFTDSEQPQATASQNFSSNESIYFSIMYRTS